MTAIGNLNSAESLRDSSLPILFYQSGDSGYQLRNNQFAFKDFVIFTRKMDKKPGIHVVDAFAKSAKLHFANGAGLRLMPDRCR